jgi:tetratricopeptide (TPR) repeat protein
MISRLFYREYDMRHYESGSKIVILILIFASLAAFGRIVGNDYILQADDSIYITDNNYVQSGINIESIKWAFTAYVNRNWHPLTMLSHMLDSMIFGANPAGHHFVSLFLHIGTIILLFLFLNRTTNNLLSSAFVAAFFGLHPLRVESVAYIAERKDVLSMFFGMASVYAYAFYTEGKRLTSYFISLVLFAMALMSKSMMVTLPFVMILLDYWPLGRWHGEINKSIKDRFKMKVMLIGEKVPFIILSIVTSIITLWTQIWIYKVSAMPYYNDFVKSIVAYVAYLEKTFWPVSLSVFYHYDFDIAVKKVLICAIILIVITSFILYFIRKVPFLFVGWCWYLGTLVPVIGFIQVGAFAMADRYTYIPSVGIAIMMAWGIPFLYKDEKYRRKILFPASLIILGILSIMTWKQCGYWKNDKTLWYHALNVTKNNELAHYHIGTQLAETGKKEESLYHFNEAIRISPNYAEAFNNRGNVYADMGEYQKAIGDYTKAILIKADYAEAYNNRGNVYNDAGKYQEALKDFKEAIRLKPAQWSAYNNRGNVFFKIGQYQQAIEDYDKVISLHVNSFEVYNNRANVYTAAGQYLRAIDDYQRAAILKPDHPYSYKGQGIIHFKQGNRKLGCRAAQDACARGDCKLLDWAKRVQLCR